MVTTSPDSLFSPDDANQYNLTVDMAAMQTSVQSALQNRTRQYTATTGAALPTSGVTAGARGYASNENLSYVYNGSKWIVEGGLLPLVNLAIPSVTAVNGSGTVVSWGGALISPSPSSMWSSGSNVVAPITGIYSVQVMMRWADTANVVMSLRRNGTAIPSGASQYGLRNTMVNTTVSLNAGDALSVVVQSYSGNQPTSEGYFSVYFLRST